MGESSTTGAPGAAGPRRKGRSWLAAFPFALAWGFAAATLNAALAPAIVDEPRLEQAPRPASAPSPPPPPPPRSHELVLDSNELISV